MQNIFDQLSQQAGKTAHLFHQLLTTYGSGDSKLNNENNISRSEQINQKQIEKQQLMINQQQAEIMHQQRPIVQNNVQGKKMTSKATQFEPNQVDVHQFCDQYQQTEIQEPDTQHRMFESPRGNLPKAQDSPRKEYENNLFDTAQEPPKQSAAFKLFIKSDSLKIKPVQKLELKEATQQYLINDSRPSRFNFKLTRNYHAYTLRKLIRLRDGSRKLSSRINPDERRLIFRDNH